MPVTGGIKEGNVEVIRDAAEFRRTLLVTLAVLGVAALLGLFVGVNQLLNKKYMAPFYREKASIVFGEADRRKFIDDLNEVTKFRTIIISAQEVAAHHSYPVDEIKFFFPDEPSKTYFLAGDSENAGEFWLEAAGWNGTIYLKQFRSESLDEWLTRNSVRPSSSRLQVLTSDLNCRRSSTALG